MNTLITGILFPVLLALLWGALLWWGFRIVRTLLDSKGTPPKNGWEMAAFLVALLVLLLFTSVESAYRPKSIVGEGINEARERRAEEVAQQPLPELKPAEPKETWEEVQRRAEEENKKAREEFDKLPPAH